MPLRRQGTLALAFLLLGVPAAFCDTADASVSTSDTAWPHACTLHLKKDQQCGGKAWCGKQICRNTTKPWPDACCAHGATCLLRKGVWRCKIAHVVPIAPGPSPAPKPKPTPAPGATTSFTTPTGPSLAPYQATLLSLHNQKRALHHAPPLAWDPAIAQAAQDHTCRCVFQHDTNHLYGENLYALWGDRLDDMTNAQRAANMWYNEISLYDYNRADWDYRTGHATQMLWRSTTKLGCGICYCASDGMTLLTCKYSPPGNYIGQFSTNVLPP